MNLHGETVEVLDTVQDRHGDKTHTVRGVLRGCAWAPTESTDSTGSRALWDAHLRSMVDTQGVMYVPPSGVPVYATDVLRRVPRSGMSALEKAALPLWQVDGTPESWRNPMTGRRPGRVIKIRLVTG